MSLRSIRPLLLMLPLLAGCGTTAASPATSPTPVTTADVDVPAVQATTLLLDWNPNSDHAGLYTALQKGYFTQHNVTPMVRLPSNATGQIALVAAGRASFAITYETDLLAARAKGLPVRSVMCIAQHPLDTVMTLKKSGITRPRQLAGKTIGMAGAPSDQPIVSAMMHDDGASISSAHMVNVGYNLLPALLAGRVDAVVGVYWTWEQLLAEQKGYPVNVMRVEKWGVPNYCELVLITNDTTIAEAPALVHGVVEAMQEGYARAEADPKLGWKSLTTADASFNTPKQETLITRSIRLLRGAIVTGKTIGYQSPAQWSHYAAWLAANHLISRKVNASLAFTNAFLALNVQ
jgi:putative hydroxymethylpyrimidine transport system substrate-binding protein